MIKDHRARRRTACVLLCLVLILSFIPATVLTQGSEDVRVGFFAFDGYHEMDGNGVRSGYGYELLQHLVGYTDWKFEYVGYGKNWVEMQDMLEAGEIDILTSAQKTEEREARFDFSEQPVGTSAAILTVKAGNSRYILGDYSNWDGMRVGLLAGNSRNGDLDEFAEEHGFSYTPVYFEDTAELENALQQGALVDAILTSNLRQIEDEWILAQFATSPFYVMVRKGDTALLSELNFAIGEALVCEPELREQLMNKYYSPQNGEQIAFTVEERRFIDEMKDVTFTAMINPDRAPFSSYEDGEPQGIIYEIAKETVKRSGLSVEFVEMKDRAEYWEKAYGGIDIRFDASYDYAQAEEMGYRLTGPYLDISIARLYKHDATEFDSVALVNDSDIARIYRQTMDGSLDTVYYDTIPEAVEAVMSGRQDMTYLYYRSADLAIYNDETNRLVVEDLYGYSNSFAVAVSTKQDRLLYSILNKAVASIGESELRAIDKKYTTYHEKPFSLVGFVYDNPFVMVGAMVLIFLVAGLLMLLYHQARKRRLSAQRLIEEKRRSELLSNALAAAEKADAAKSRFLSRVSHEMRTPLNAIIGFLTLAKDSDAQKTTVYLDNANVAAKQLLSVINDVLDMSAIESGKLKLANSAFDFKHMIHDITNIYLFQCSQKGIDYETKLATQVDEWIIGDQLRVNQILINLLGNAVKFTEKGRVWLTLSQREGQDGQIFLRFEVADTGCGMSEEMQERLFRPFEQESAATAQRYGGSGLGLSIVKNLVSMMGGAIKVDSVCGEGTVFTVDLPFTKCAVAESARVPAKDLRVLAVDDSAVECDYISTVLTRIGVRHTCVNNGDDAIAELTRSFEEHDPYNVCLIDWKMPGMDGIATTKRIREKYGEDVIVIVISAYEHHQADESAREAGANLFVSKPLFQSSLFDLFMTLTGGRLAQKMSASVTHDFSGRRVLLAEDNAMNRIVAEGLIGKYGIECYSAEDGRIAVDKFTASPGGYYDAILMDIQMPNVDGFEATRLIRSSSHPDAGRIQIIALTANAFNEDVAKALSAGMNGHVAKPIYPDVLLHALEKAFDLTER